MYGIDDTILSAHTIVLWARARRPLLSWEEIGRAKPHAIPSSTVQSTKPKTYLAEEVV